MVGKIIAAVSGPFAIALLAVLLLLGGVGLGFIVADRMAKNDLERRKQIRIAAEIAARGAPKPERVPAIRGQASPFAPRYLAFGEEFTSNFKEPKRVLVVEITLMTQRGERAYKLIENSKMPLRALTLATLSEFPLQTATAADGALALSRILKTALNSDLSQKTGLAPIDEVLITNFFVQ
jgi:flagellar basal body-associated protein FliL